MDTSTPITSRRETQLIVLDDESPIGGNSDTSSGMSSDEVIPGSKTKAGMSNELNSMAVTPPKELSPDTMCLKLALHSVDIVNSSKNNHLVAELWEEEEHILAIGENTFAKKDVEDVNQEPCSNLKWSDDAIGFNNGPDIVVKQSGGMDGMNKNESVMVDSKQSVAMDGMNKIAGEEEKGKRSVVMDGMNKEKERGGVMVEQKDDGPTVVDKGLTLKEDNIKTLNEGGARKKKTARRLRMDSLDKPPTLGKLVLGSRAEVDMLNTRACPGIQSPKRPKSSLMEIDQPTPPKRRRSEKEMVRRVPKGGRKIPLSLPSNQPLLTEVWKKEDK